MTSINPSHRSKVDVIKLMSNNFEVVMFDNYHNLLVKFHGPADTPYEKGVWLVKVILPENYPFSSPSIGFDNEIFHPNVDQASGSICLDVLNQKWTALYDLLLVFETFLPQLLRNPNVEDPLNHCAALILKKTPEKFKNVVQKHVQEFADPKKVSLMMMQINGFDDTCSDLSDDE